MAVVDAVDPIQGICYAPLPCLTNCHASMDIGQSGYENLWASSGRDDLGIMARMGAKSLRVYHPIGEPTQPEPDHAPFLNAVRSAGLSMFAAVHQYLTCPEDNCYESWHTAVADGLAKGFEEGGKWHSAVWAVNMINEVDAIVPFDAPERQVMRLISAVDGLLAAEMAAKVTGEVKLTSCFTTAIAVPLGGGAATVYHGFSSIEAWIKNPGLVPYTPRSMTTAQLAAAIDSRWVHCANAQIPWSGLKAYSVRLGQTVCVIERKKTFPENTHTSQLGPAPEQKLHTQCRDTPETPAEHNRTPHHAWRLSFSLYRSIPQFKTCF